jgi:hypothetical protein
MAQIVRDVPAGRRPLLPSNVPRVLVELFERMHVGEPADRITAVQVRDAIASEKMKTALRAIGFMVDGEEHVEGWDRLVEEGDITSIDAMDF